MLTGPQDDRSTERVGSGSKVFTGREHNRLVLPSPLTAPLTQAGLA
jgi:hypothetical protein